MEGLHWICVILALIVGVFVGVTARDHDWFRRLHDCSDPKLYKQIDANDQVYWVFRDKELTTKFLKIDRLNEYIKGRQHYYCSKNGIVFMDDKEVA
jgi:hypothetical protein